MTALKITPIGTITSPYKEKFAIPRQPGVVDAAQGRIGFHPPYNDVNCVRGLEQYSHLWLIFQFHHTSEQGWSPLVRPPRLGGNQKVGVFATRSTFRPNNMGLSVVKLNGIEITSSGPELVVQGMDLLDGTPILDIKPYIPYADAIADANGGFAQQAPAADMAVEFSPQAQRQVAEYQQRHPHLDSLIRQVLCQDPRPAYKQSRQDEKVYGMRLYDYNIQWQVDEAINKVLSITLTL